MTDEESRVNPRSCLVERVSESVLMTVRKMATLRGSPWYTPICRGTGAVYHFSVEMVADRPVYIDCIKAQNSGGAWYAGGELNQGVMYTPICIGDVKPGHC